MMRQCGLPNSVESYVPNCVIHSAYDDHQAKAHVNAESAKRPMFDDASIGAGRQMGQLRKGCGWPQCDPPQCESLGRLNRTLSRALWLGVHRVNILLSFLKPAHGWLFNGPDCRWCRYHWTERIFFRTVLVVPTCVLCVGTACWSACAIL